MALYSRVQDQDVRGKRVLLRVDLNLPMKSGKVTDDTRLLGVLPTIKLLRENGARTVLVSHFGRPDGKASDALSMRPIAELISERIGMPVAFASDCIGEPAQTVAAALKDGDVAMLENVRFHAEEEKNDPEFAKQLASLCDLYVNDAFGAAHRAHASTAGITQYVPAAAGLLMQAELDALETLTAKPKSPYVCAIGGSKVSDKVRVFTSLIDKVDAFVIGGGMANTFLAAQGVAVGSSLCEANLEPAKDILRLAESKGVTLYLPIDAVTSPAFDADDKAHVVEIAQVGDEMILDIGPKTAALYADQLRAAQTIIFNGPMGVYEKTAYQSGTRTVCEGIAAATKAGAVTVVGGGDAASAAKAMGFGDSFTHISTGGGAMLEFLEGKKLPGVAALENATVNAG
jgi:phosphoglycerate kinase